MKISLVILMCAPTPLWAQTSRPAAPAAPAVASAPAAPAPQPTSAKEQAPVDLSGYWVSMITQNWQYRMIVPGPGEYADIPINEQAKKSADAWTAAQAEAAGKQCEAYGAAAIMRVPTRLHIQWLDANELRVDTDSGMQTRVLHFEPAAPGTQTPPSLQGYSQAKWALPPGGQARNGGGQPVVPAKSDPNEKHYGSLELTTDHLLPGLLRKNGVPYGPDTKMHEWWDLRTEPTGEQWLSISIKVEDPEFLLEPYFYDSVFKREPDGSKWDPSPCSLSS